MIPLATDCSICQWVRHKNCCHPEHQVPTTVAYQFISEKQFRESALLTAEQLSLQLSKQKNLWDCNCLTYHLIQYHENDAVPRKWLR